MKLILLGNAGSGKTTMARRVMGDRDIPRLSLDEIAWNDRTTQRKSLDESLKLLHEFISANGEWIIEGCYGDLIEAALPHCTELHFLNPGVETCIAHCRARPFEPEKFTAPEDQQAMLDHLIDWVRAYESRDDEFGLQRHRRIYEMFNGPKREYTNVASYDPMPHGGTNP